MDAARTLSQLEVEFQQRMTAFEGELQKNLAASPNMAGLAAEFSTYKAFVTKALKALQQQISVMSQSIDQIEQRSRRKILLLHGVTEAKDEVLPTVIVGVLRERLQTEFSKNAIQRCQRMGRAAAGKPRPILIKFDTMNNRDSIWQSKTRLKGTGYTISEFLTKTRHQLFMSARRTFGISKSWTHQGSIYVVDAEGVRHSIRRPEDLLAVQSKAAEVTDNIIPKPKLLKAPTSKPRRVAATAATVAITKK